MNISCGLLNFFTSYIIYTGETDINKFEINTFYPYIEVEKLAKKYYYEIKSDLEHGQKLFSEFIDYIFNINKIEDIKDFSNRIRFYIYYTSHSKKIDRFINNSFSMEKGFKFKANNNFDGTAENDLITFLNLNHLLMLSQITHLIMIIFMEFYILHYFNLYSIIDIL